MSFPVSRDRPRLADSIAQPRRAFLSPLPRHRLLSIDINMPSHRSREEDAPARYDRDHSDEEDFAHSALPATRTSSRGSRRDYDGESDSVEDTDEEDRKLEAELWDEEEVVGAQTGRSKDKKEEGGRQWVMNAIGKSGGSRSQVRTGPSSIQAEADLYATNSNTPRSTATVTVARTALARPDPPPPAPVACTPLPCPSVSENSQATPTVLSWTTRSVA